MFVKVLGATFFYWQNFAQKKIQIRKKWILRVLVARNETKKSLNHHIYILFFIV